jgi:hypothetical protein
VGTRAIKTLDWRGIHFIAALAFSARRLVQRDNKADRSSGGRLCARDAIAALFKKFHASKPTAEILQLRIARVGSLLTPMSRAEFMSLREETFMYMCMREERNALSGY